MAIKAAFFDCDGTLTTVKSSWEYLHRRLNLWDDHADEFQRLFREGRIDYYEFCRRDAELWKGLRLGDVMKIIGEIPYHEGVREAMKVLHDADIFTVILSTGLSLLVEKVRRELGMTRAVANELVVEDGVITGEIRINVQYDNKGAWVEAILAELGLGREEAAACGDGEGDRGMFEAVGFAIGYHPEPKVLPLLHSVLHDGSFARVADLVRAYR
jgi:phosphoserine phosphatase